jgi:hypothetical protein
MQAVLSCQFAADILCNVRIQLDFGDMSPAAAESVYQRILNKQL